MGLRITTILNGKPFWTAFLLLLCSSALAVFIVLYPAIAAFKQQELDKWINQHTQSLQNISKLSNKEVAGVIGDARYLASLPQLKSFLSDASDANRESLEQTLSYFSESHPNYFQIRYIDKSGMEQVRVDRKDERVDIVSRDQRQDKSDRYYFIDAQKSFADQAYLSRIDLNVENGSIEMPWKPTLRVAVRVYDRHGDSRGIVIINHNVTSLLDEIHLKEYDRVLAGAATELLNTNGYWLVAKDPSKRFGFMDGRANITLAVEDPQLWERIDSEFTSTTVTETHLYLSQKIFPLVNAKSTAPVDDVNKFYWILLRTIPLSSIYENGLLSVVGGPLRATFLLFVGVAIVFCLSFYFQRSRLANKELVLRSQQKEREFRSYLESSPNVIIISDTQGVIVFASSKVKQLLDYEPHELVGLSIEVLVPTGSRIRHVDLRGNFVGAAEQKPMSLDRTDLMALNKHQQPVPVTISLATMTLDHRTVVISSLQDDTVRRQNELALLDSQRQADAANQAKSLFLANMSHEIRTPLNAIIGLLYLAKHDVSKDQILERINDIEHSSKVLLTLINDILDISKIEAGEFSLELRPFNLFGLFDHLAIAARGYAANKDIDLIFYMEDLKNQTVIGDELRIGQIVLNLINNAIKFTHRGSVKLSITRVDDNNIAFEVSDTGIGMSPATVEKILHPFTQADNSTSREYGGSGLGLSIVNALVGHMDGEFSVVSAEGQGTTARVVLALPTAHETIEYLNTANVDFTAIKVLVAEDNFAARQSMMAMLVHFGCQVDSASDGEEAVDMVHDALENEAPYTLVFMDWRMPKMDGISAMKKIREDAGNKAPVIILETAFGRELLDQENNRDAFDGILIKPITPSDLHDAIINHCNNAQWREIHTPPVRDEKPLKDLHILLVEDSSVNQMVMKSVLNRFGANVSLADNGQIAVDLLNSQQLAFDMILMDMQMPVMDGLEATRRIRAGDVDKDIPIVALTANAMKQERDKCFAAGMNEYLTKPIDADLMVSVLLRTLEATHLTPKQ